MVAAFGPTQGTIERAVRRVGPGQILVLGEAGGADSWRRMFEAYHRKVTDPNGDLYAVFFIDRVKFQYPPSSLLMFDLFPSSMTRTADSVRQGQPLRQWLDGLSRVAVVQAVVTSVLIFEIGLRRVRTGQPDRVVARALRIGLSLLLGLMYYPLLIGHQLGQVQVFLNGLIALGVLFFVLGRRTAAGVCFGACCLVKPQYGLLLLWSLVRMQWRFALGVGSALLVGLAASVVRFGLRDHVRYLDVVRELSRVGEAYWPNQSVNGLLNRLLENGDPLRFFANEFVPYHPVIYAVTVASSVTFLLLALWPGGERRGPADPIDLTVMLVAVTMASPIAWEHHYGAILPVFAVALPRLLLVAPLGRATSGLFALSYVAMANVLVVPQVVFRDPWLGLAGSHLFFGSLLLFGLLIVLRAVGDPNTRLIGAGVVGRSEGHSPVQ
jgi:alpha-1,2-mannosyltransferase